MRCRVAVALICLCACASRASVAPPTPPPVPDARPAKAAIVDDWKAVYLGSPERKQVEYHGFEQDGRERWTADGLRMLRKGDAVEYARQWLTDSADFAVRARDVWFFASLYGSVYVAPSYIGDVRLVGGIPEPVVELEAAGELAALRDVCGDVWLAARDRAPRRVDGVHSDDLDVDAEGRIGAHDSEGWHVLGADGSARRVSNFVPTRPGVCCKEPREDAWRGVVELVKARRSERTRELKQAVAAAHVAPNHIVTADVDQDRKVVTLQVKRDAKRIETVTRPLPPDATSCHADAEDGEAALICSDEREDENGSRREGAVFHLLADGSSVPIFHEELRYGGYRSWWLQPGRVLVAMDGWASLKWLSLDRPQSKYESFDVTQLRTSEPSDELVGYAVVDSAFPWVVARSYRRTGYLESKTLGVTLVNAEERLQKPVAVAGHTTVEAQLSADGQALVAVVRDDDTKRRSLLLGAVGSTPVLHDLPKGALYASFVTARRGVVAGETLAQLWYTLDGARSFHALELAIIGDPAAVRGGPVQCERHYCYAKSWTWAEAAVIDGTDAAMTPIVAGNPPRESHRSRACSHDLERDAATEPK